MTNNMNFWQWLIKGGGAKPGYRRLINKWFIFHVLIGLGLTTINPSDLKTAADSVLLPLAGVLIGLSFAWAGNAQALLQTSEIEEMAEYREGGFMEYVFTYQIAIFTILLTLVAWTLAGLGVFDSTWPKTHCEVPYFLVSTGLFTLSSLTLRECWHVVLGAQFMLLARWEIKRAKKQK